MGSFSHGSLFCLAVLFIYLPVSVLFPVRRALEFKPMCHHHCQTRFQRWCECVEKQREPERERERERCVLLAYTEGLAASQSSHSLTLALPWPFPTYAMYIIITAITVIQIRVTILKKNRSKELPGMARTKSTPQCRDIISP